MSRQNFACVSIAIVAAALVFSGCRGDPAEELNACASELQYRLLDARLTSVAYAPPPSQRRATKTVVLAELKLRDAAMRLGLSARSDELRARAALFVGGRQAAKLLLQKITLSNHASAGAWSDYAAALYADAAPDDALQLSAALAATDRALEIDPKLPEALFNRAVVLSALSLREPAVAAYYRYLLVDESSPWALEVRSRLREMASSQIHVNLSQKLDELIRAAEAGDELFINDTATAMPEDSRRLAMLVLDQWGNCVQQGDSLCAARRLELCRVIGRALEDHQGDSLIADVVRAIDRAAEPRLLATAHVAYAYGKRALLRGSIARALADIEKAQRTFEMHRSPMALLARYDIVNATRQRRAGRDAIAFKNLLDSIPQAYPSFRAHVQMSIANVSARNGLRDDALKSIRTADAAFAALGEEKYRSFTRDATATLLAASGNTAEAWRQRYASFVAATQAGDNLRLRISVHSAARDAIVDGRWDVAHALLNATADISSRNQHADAMVWRAVAAKRAGMPRLAAAHLRAARAENPQSSDLPLVEAFLEEDNDKAVGLLTDALRSARDKLALSRLLVERARRYRATGESTRAHHDLEQAVDLLRGHSQHDASTITDAVLGSPRDAYIMLAESLDTRGETHRALEVLEDSRTNVRDGLVRVPAHSCVITYGVFNDRVAIYINSSRGFTRVAVRIAPAEVRRLVMRFQPDNPRTLQIDDFHATSRALYRILVAPVAMVIEPEDTLVFVSDPALQLIPFAALLQDNDRYLIEDHAVVVTPSITSWRQSLDRKRTIPRALLAAGNPDASLAGAEAEAKKITEMYPSRALLLGAAATKRRVISSLAYCDVAHFALHANIGLGDSMPPHLLLAQTGVQDNGLLTAAEIAQLQLDNIRTVVLAGCRTAAASSPRISNARSLVDAFLAAGAGNVVGTLWRIDDTLTREMSVVFHRELRNGSTPAAALRTAQAMMIGRSVSPRSWAAFQLYGSGF